MWHTKMIEVRTAVQPLYITIAILHRKAQMNNTAWVNLHNHFAKIDFVSYAQRLQLI